MSQENVDALRAVYGEWAEGDFRAGLELFDPLVMMIPGADSTDTGHYVGPEAMGNYMRGILAAWKDYTMTADEFIEAENSVVVSVLQRGVGKESGLTGEMRFFAAWTFRGCNVIRLETFRDRSEAFEAVGLRE